MKAKFRLGGSARVIHPGRFSETVFYATLNISDSCINLDVPSNFEIIAG